MFTFIAVVVFLMMVVFFFSISRTTPLAENSKIISHLNWLIVLEPVLLLILWGFLASVLYRVLWEAHIISSSTYGFLVKDDWGRVLGVTWVLAISLILLILIWRKLPLRTNLIITSFVLIRWLIIIGIGWFWVQSPAWDWLIIALIVYIGLCIGAVAWVNSFAQRRQTPIPADQSPFQTPIVYAQPLDEVGDRGVDDRR